MISLAQNKAARGHTSSLMSCGMLSPAAVLVRRRSVPCRAVSNGPQQGVVDGNCVVQLSASSRTETAVKAQPSGDLAAYIRASPEFFGSLAKLPLGGSLQPVDLDQGLFELIVPRIQLFDLWIQPKSRAIVKVEDVPGGAARLAIRACECTLQGSHHVQTFRLNERFQLDVSINFTSHQPSGVGTSGAIKVDGGINVQVDIPPPFSFMPAPLLQRTGDSALAGTIALLLGAFTTAMASDYVRWSQAQHQLQDQQALKNMPHKDQPITGSQQASSQSYEQIMSSDPGQSFDSLSE